MWENFLEELRAMQQQMDHSDWFLHHGKPRTVLARCGTWISQFCRMKTVSSQQASGCCETMKEFIFTTVYGNTASLCVRQVMIRLPAREITFKVNYFQKNENEAADSR